MQASRISKFIYGLGLLALVVAGVAFVNAPMQTNIAPLANQPVLQGRTPPPTATDSGTPNLTATLQFTQTQTAVAQTATALARTQTSVAQTATSAAQTTTAGQTATALARTQTAAAQNATATALAATQTALAATQTVLARTATSTMTAVPTGTLVYTITPLSGGVVVATITSVPTPTSALPSTGLPLAWVIVAGVLILIAVGARHLRQSADR